MFHKKVFALFLSLLLVSMTACNLVAAPGGNGSSQNQQTLVKQAMQQSLDAQTRVAQAVQGTLAARVTNTPQFTMTPSLTPTPEIPLVHVTVDTNCRKGPGLVYAIVEGLMVGEQAEVYGVDPAHAFWYIRNADAPTGHCWVGGLYATVVGNVSVLPVLTPPPTPAPVPSYKFSYKSFGVGPGTQCFLFEVTNTGQVTWESYAITMRNTIHGDSHFGSGDVFTSYDNWCIPTGSQQDLTAGETGVASVPTALAYNPAGENFSMTITLCPGNGMTGACVSMSTVFTP